MRGVSQGRPRCGIPVLLVACAAFAGVIPSLIGCSRSFYRQQADDDARRLVLEKSQDPRWCLADFSIEMDPHSRYYDPYDPDFPPMPPDDPASHELMHRVDGKKGYKYWHEKYGDLPGLENPGWRDFLNQYAEITDNGEIKLGLDDALRLARINDPSYQSQLEELYLSALDVSTERFRFDVQFLQSFSGSDLGFTHLGSEKGRRPLGGPGSTDTLSLDTDLRIRRRFATAGELLVGFANSVVWQFAGEDSTATASLLNFSLVQPLLRAGGRAVALETLTIAERALLANVRALQQWHQGYFTQIAIGDDGNIQGPSRRGGFFGGTGLTAFFGTGASGFGGVGSNIGRGGFGGGGPGGGGGTAGIAAGGGAGRVGGFIGLLQQLQELRNQRDNFFLQLRTLELLEAHQQAGLIGLDQVLQFQQAIETARANLLQAQDALESSLDIFKIRPLGLPPRVPIQLDDTFIRPFQFIDPRISTLENDLAAFISEFGDVETPTLEQLQQFLEQFRDLRDRTDEQFQIVSRDLETLQGRSEQRTERMTPSEHKAFMQTKTDLHETFMQLKTRFAQAGMDLEQLRSQLNSKTVQQAIPKLIELHSELNNVVGELSLVQVRARLESIVLRPVRLDSDEALEIARANRLDWMNNRAALVDTWRLIEFNANRLQSDLSVEFSGDIGTVGDNPVKFRDDTGRLSASLSFDGPFTRLEERNNFRQQLINYQQARRQLIQFGDNIARSLRQTLRLLKEDEINLEIQRRAVTIAASRVDQARLNLMRPVAPPEPGQPPEQFGPTAARDLVDAIQALQAVQNNFMSVWLRHYANRMVLMRDLGIMRIDENGMWIEEPLDEALRAAAEAAPLPPAIPDDWVDEWLREPDGADGDSAPLQPQDSKAPAADDQATDNGPADSAPMNVPPAAEPSARKDDRKPAIGSVDRAQERAARGPALSGTPDPHPPPHWRATGTRGDPQGAKGGG